MRYLAVLLVAGSAFAQTTVVNGWGSGNGSFGTITGQPTDNASLTPYLTFSANVKAYGAKCDGSTDDAAAFNSAMTALTNNSGGNLYLPSATCVVGAPILIPQSVPITIQGNGPSSVITLKAGANADVLRTNGFASLTGTQGTTDGTYQLILRDFVVDGNKANNTSGYGVRLWGNQLHIEGLIIKNCAQDGLYTEWYGDKSSPAFGNAGYAMEGYFVNIKLLSNGLNGWTQNGPHDSLAVGVISAMNGGWGVFVGGYNTTGAPYSKGGLHSVGMHVWANNRNSSGAGGIDVNTSSEFTNTQADGDGQDLIKIESGAGQVNFVHLALVGTANTCTGVHNLNLGTVIMGGKVYKCSVGLNEDGATAETTILRAMNFKSTTTAVQFSNAGGVVDDLEGMLDFSGAATSGTVPTSAWIKLVNPSSVSQSTFQDGVPFTQLNLQNSTPSTGAVNMLVQAGPGQSSNDLITIKNSGGTKVAGMGAAGESYIVSSSNFLAQLRAAIGFEVSTAGTYAFSSTNQSFGTVDAGLSRSAAGVIAVGTGANGSAAGTLKAAYTWSPVTTVGALVACAAGTEGYGASVSDSTTSTFGATVAGSGSNHVSVYCNGTNWTVH